MNYYKVVDYIDSSVIIDTEVCNYSITLSRQRDYENLIAFITKSSDTLDLPLDMYFTLNNNIVILGNLYIQQFPKSNNGIFEVYDFTKIEKHKYFFINEIKLIEIIEYLISIDISVFNEGFYLWEYIYEKVKLLKHSIKPTRIKSFFLFENIADCNYYINKHKRGGTICQVELIETKSLFSADMNLLDIIPNHFTYKETAKQADSYWNGDVSDKPIMEIIFQGKCELVPITK